MAKHTYWKQRPLGTGGGGVVYEGRSRFPLGQHERPCAVKVLHRSQVRDPASVQRFAREAMLGYELSGHPHVVGTRTFGASPSGQPYLVMDLEGPTLRDLEPGIGRDPALVWRIAADLVAGLLALETRERSHGDLNQGNVFVGTDGVVKLGDFGKSDRPGDDRPALARVLARLLIGAPPSDHRGALRALPDHVPTALRAFIEKLDTRGLTLREAVAYLAEQRADFADIQLLAILATSVRDARGRVVPRIVIQHAVEPLRGSQGRVSVPAHTEIRLGLTILDASLLAEQPFTVIVHTADGVEIESEVSLP